MDRRTDEEESRHRAFIAAPLLGTMIFLIAILYAVNLSKDEASAVSQIGDDAYHNRLVSMLEIYRDDLLGFFSDGLRQNTEDFLSSAAWSGLNDVKEFSAAERSSKCENIANTVRGQLISSGTSNQNFLNGFSDLLNEVRKTYVFEGLTFSPVKFDSFKMSTDDMATWNFTCDTTAGRILCERMLPGSTFDCENYATNLASPYQCCAQKPTAGSTCNVIRGCEDGGFYLAVDISDPDVYKAMPRMEISDALGNTVRTAVLGAISFQVPIRYPIYRYNDASFRIFAITQYLNTVLATAATAPEGKQAIPSDFGSKDGVNRYLEANKVACQFLYNYSFSSGIKPFKSFDFEVTQRGGTITCSNGIANGVDALKAAYDIYNDPNSPGSMRPVSLFYIPIKITDNDPRFRVNPENPNSYLSSHTLSEPTS